jgi:hypothetical protein
MDSNVPAILTTVDSNILKFYLIRYQHAERTEFVLEIHPGADLFFLGNL